jgi:hypothetical protein
MAGAARREDEGEEEGCRGERREREEGGLKTRGEGGDGVGGGCRRGETQESRERNVGDGVGDALYVDDGLAAGYFPSLDRLRGDVDDMPRPPPDSNIAKAAGRGRVMLRNPHRWATRCSRHLAHEDVLESGRTLQ